MVWGLAAVSLAAGDRPAASKDRVSEIWDYATERFTRQQDVWFEDGDYPATIQLLRVICEIHPNDYDLVTNLGWMLENVEAWDEALSVYSRFAKDNPKDPDRALPAADYYFRRHMYAPIPALLEVTIGGPGHLHPNNYRILAHAYEKLGKLPDAERIWKKYIALAPDDLPAKNNLNRVEKKLAKKG